AKSALTSTARYLARYVGDRNVRVNLVSAGPLGTMAARSIPGFAELAQHWPERAPLGWDINDPEPAAKAVVALLSDWFPATTGEIVHVDGGFHSTGALRHTPRGDRGPPAVGPWHAGPVRTAQQERRSAWIWDCQGHESWSPGPAEESAGPSPRCLPRRVRPWPCVPVGPRPWRPRARN